MVDELIPQLDNWKFLLNLDESFAQNLIKAEGFLQCELFDAAVYGRGDVTNSN